MIQLRNLEKAYKTNAGFTYVLRQISLGIADGEFVTIMGPSGAGKSTLLAILGMYDHAWEGQFFFSEYPVHQMAAKERAKVNKKFVGFVFQQFHLLDDLTVAENLDIPLSYRDIRKSERSLLLQTYWTASTSLARRTFFRTNFPADNSNSSRSRAQSLRSQSFFSRMNPRAIFTRTKPAKLWSCSKS